MHGERTKIKEKNLSKLEKNQVNEDSDHKFGSIHAVSKSDVVGAAKTQNLRGKFKPLTSSYILCKISTF